MSDRVIVDVDAGVADVRLNRSDKLNACDFAMFDALGQAGRALAEERSLRAVVLSGQGRAFCAGIDVSGFAGGGGGSDGRSLFDREEGRVANLVQDAAWVWHELPVPVIAAVHGVAYGAGIQVALAADIRFVAPDARLSVMEIKWGLIPDVSGTQSLRRLLRLDVAKELVYTGRVVSGTEALALGLATHVSEAPREAALELAREIARKSPSAIRAAKRLMNESGLVGVEEGLLLEERLQRELIGRPDQIEAVRSTLEKRAPQYEDPA